LPKEQKALVEKLQTKLKLLVSKLYECEVVYKGYETNEKELEINYESSRSNVQSNMKYLTDLISQKEEALLSELKQIKDNKTNEVSQSKQKVETLKAAIENVCMILKESINKPKFTLDKGSKYVNKRVELLENEISTDLVHKKIISIKIANLIDVTPMNNLLSSIKFQENKSIVFPVEDKEVNLPTIEPEELVKEEVEVKLKENDEVSLIRPGSS